MLTIRQRGKSGYWYVRGTVKVGTKTYQIKEQCCGTSRKAEADEYASKLAENIRQQILYGNLHKDEQTTFENCLEVYLTYKRLKNKELANCAYMNKIFGDVYITDISKKWNEFCSKNNHLKQASLNKYATILNAIINYAKDHLEFNFKPLKKIPVKNEVIFSLTDDVREKLLSCYSERTYPLFLIYSLQGFREQELLQLKWDCVNFNERTMTILTSKNGETRVVPMHNQTYNILFDKWVKANKPSMGHVFLTQKGKPYTDTRRLNGGSPVRKAHILALQRLKERHGIELKMRVHDWRHDWASRMVMAGVDLLTLQSIGGWKSLDMVKRYATFTNKHKQDAINKI